MKCYSCGAEIPNGTKFCTECGARQLDDYQAAPAPSAFNAEQPETGFGSSNPAPSQSFFSGDPASSQSFFSGESAPSQSFFGTDPAPSESYFRSGDTAPSQTFFGAADTSSEQTFFGTADTSSDQQFFDDIDPSFRTAPENVDFSANAESSFDDTASRFNIPKQPSPSPCIIANQLKTKRGFGTYLMMFLPTIMLILCCGGIFAFIEKLIPIVEAIEQNQDPMEMIVQLLTGSAAVLGLLTVLGPILGLVISFACFYRLIVMCHLIGELNVVASRYDGRKTMHPLFVIHIPIANLIWFSRFSDRIGRELKRRNLSYRFGKGTFWGWGFFGSLILVGPFIYGAKLLKAMNRINESYNYYG